MQGVLKNCAPFGAVAFIVLVFTELDRSGFDLEFETLFVSM